MNRETREHRRSIPEERRDRFLSIHDLILNLCPKIQVDVGCRMPTYRLGDGWVALANKKNSISVYTCSGSHPEPCKEKHPQQKTGKACINFRMRNGVHYDELKTVIKHAIEHPESWTLVSTRKSNAYPLSNDDIDGALE